MPNDALKTECLGFLLLFLAVSTQKSSTFVPSFFSVLNTKTDPL